jgi:hypothetical protein
MVANRSNNPVKSTYFHQNKFLTTANFLAHLSPFIHDVQCSTDSFYPSCIIINNAQGSNPATALTTTAWILSHHPHQSHPTSRDLPHKSPAGPLTNSVPINLPGNLFRRITSIYPTCHRNPLANYPHPQPTIEI